MDDADFILYDKSVKLCNQQDKAETNLHKSNTVHWEIIKCEHVYFFFLFWRIHDATVVKGGRRKKGTMIWDAIDMIMPLRGLLALSCLDPKSR